MAVLALLTTPIGNMEDIAPRVKRYLMEGSIFAVEDTRSFKNLCSMLGILLTDKKILSFHDHSDESRVNEILKILDRGNDVSIVSEAGSPLVSDPAYPLISAVLEQGHELDSIGSTSAVICALELSGLAPTPFHFHGFPPRDGGKRRSYYDSLLAVSGTHIFFEGVSRAESSIRDLVNNDPNGKFAVGRELTKAFQSVYRFDTNNFESILSEITWKGEFVLLWQNNNKVKTSSKATSLAQEILETGAHPKKLGKLLAELTGESPKSCYEKLLSSRN